MMQSRQWSMRLVLAVLAMIALASPVKAESAGVLDARDKLILELLQRIEALERRVGVQGNAGNAIAVMQQDIMPAAQGSEEPMPVMAPGRIVVNERDAERALERSLTRVGALLLPRGVLEIEPGFRYARREDRAPNFVTRGSEVFSGEIERNTNHMSADLGLRLGLPWEAQMEIAIPYQWREVGSVTRVGFASTAATSNSGEGVGDLRLGVAKTLFRERLWRPDLVARFGVVTDWGERRDNGVALGGNAYRLQGSLSAIKRQDPLAFVGGVSFEYARESDHFQPGQTLAASFGTFLALSPETSLSLRFALARQQESELFGRQIDGSEQLQGSFIVGLSSLVAPGMLMNLSAGIGLTDDAEDFSLSLSLPLRFGRSLF